MKYTAFQEKMFRDMVENALVSVQEILDVNRKPQLAEDMDHQYDDKYALAEFLTNTTIASQMNVLERMGLSEGKLEELYNIVHVHKRSVTICFEAEDMCTFLKEQTVDVVNHDVEHVIENETSSFYGVRGNTSIRHKVVQKVVEYHWKVAAQYRIFCYEGNDPQTNCLELLSRSSSTTIVTTGSKAAPFPEHTVHNSLKTELTWLMKNIQKSDKEYVCAFKIDRMQDSCRTPRRNGEIQGSITFFRALSSWFDCIKRHFIKRIETQILGKHHPANHVAASKEGATLSSISASSLFCPVVPLLESNEGRLGTDTHQEPRRALLVIRSPTGDNTSPLLSVGDIDKLLAEQERTYDVAMASLTATFPSHQLLKLSTVAEASLVLFSMGTSSLNDQYYQCIEYLEEMLRKQLHRAIGKEIKSRDFHQFMRFYSSTLFAPQFSPKPFCYAIRRPLHYPDGILSIEQSGRGEDVEPISTHVRHIPGKNEAPIYIPINSATSIEITGDRFLHGWINHRFSSDSTEDYNLTARARQFSSFILMVGVMGGSDKFVPKDAIILQNKDEVLIPLLLKDLPTAKEFKDATASLSPEQQRFASSYRGMQLESSVFGVCVVQLKPQLEALLGLPPDSLTKEIRLNQDLMTLFVDYQIPSDLLSFDGASDAPVKDKVDRVKEHTKAVLDVIMDAKKAEMEEMERSAKYNADRLKRNAELPYPQMMMSQPFGAARESCVIVHASESLIEHSAIMEAYEQLGDRFVSKDLDVNEDKTKSSVLDFTALPKQLDNILERFDSDGAIRTTILEASKPWRYLRQENLLSKPKETTMDQAGCKSEMNKAFDLLDALSRSGALPIPFAELHVIVAVTHLFANDVMGTVVQDNINPIEKMEKSLLMVASTIHGEPHHHLIGEESQLVRLKVAFPDLIQDGENDGSPS